MGKDSAKTDGPVVRSYVDEGLGNSAYLVGDAAARTAALIDPLRDADRYVNDAERLGLRLAYTLDTHLHNDFVTGAREVASRAGAEVGASAEADLAFDHRPLKEGDRLAVGRFALRVLATPGHTPEHISFLLEDADGRSLALFSGGALIVGGAARTDLLGSEKAEPLARQLYHTVHDKLLKLPDDVAVLPTHGTGSFCAAPAMPYRTTTLKQEARYNPLVRATTEDEFVAAALSGLGSYPAYFRHLRPINKAGPKVLGGLPALETLPPKAVAEWSQNGGAVLDVRPPPAFVRGHVPGAYGIWVHGPLTTWAGWLIPFGTPLVLVTDGVADSEEAVRQLIRIGYDDLRGVLDGGMAAWAAAGFPVETVRVTSAREVHQRRAAGQGPTVLDVRQEDEWVDGHIPAAVHIENGRLPWEELPFDKDEEIAVHCHTGNRSVMATAVLARRGYRNVSLLDGGIAAWARAGFELERGSGGG